MRSIAACHATLLLTWINATAARRSDAASMCRRSLSLSLILSVVLASCASDQATPPPRTPQSDEAVCVSYGFVPGTTAYITCVRREIDARRSGKLGPTYDQRLIAPKPAS